MAAEAAGASAAWMPALLSGLNAVLWERDPDTLDPTCVSEEAERLLGYPAAHWTRPGFWSSVLHPEDRAEAVAALRRGIAAGRTAEVSYRMLARDGGVVWVRDLVHAAPDPGGGPVRLHGLLIDITEQRRREQDALLLLDVSRLIAAAGPVSGRLTELVHLMVADGVGEVVTVSLRTDDERLRPVAAAPAPAAEVILALGPVTPPADLAARYRSGRAVLVPEVDERIVRDSVRDGVAWRAVLDPGPRTALHVPLVNSGLLVGVLTVERRLGARFPEPVVGLAEEVGRRVAAMVAAERAAVRGQHLQRVAAALAAAQHVAEVAEVLATGFADALGPSAHRMFVLDPAARTRLDHGAPHRVRDPLHGHLRLVEGVGAGYSERLLADHASIDLADRVPLADAARTGEPVWLRDREDWRARYPGVTGMPEVTGRAMLCLPMRAEGRVVAVLTAAFDVPRDFPAAEREFALTLAGLGGQAIARAMAGERHRAVAETLQRSLLPSALPRLDRLMLAAHYLPAAYQTRAGGDWYDVLALDRHRVVIVVGDVVGHGPAAAGVMGQLRSALAAYLLADHSPADALRLLNGVAQRTEGALGSTAICLLIDTESGRLSWSRAGHPPPLLVAPSGARYLDDARGGILGVAGPEPFTQGHARLDPGSTVLLYTDGLVERRGELIDDGLARLAGAAASHHELAPEPLTADAIRIALAGHEAADDVAVIAARLLPGPIRERCPATIDELRRLRRRVDAWSRAGALSDLTREDLVLAVSEAGENIVEHAYRYLRPAEAPGELEVALSRAAGGGVQAMVRDFGSWRPTPDDPGHRGRGLQVIRQLSERFAVTPGETGTVVEFTIAEDPVELRPVSGPATAAGAAGSPGGAGQRGASRAAPSGRTTSPLR